MKIKELAQKTIDGGKSDLSKLSEQYVATIARTVFEIISSEIQAVSEGVVKVQGLGNFKIRQVDVEGEKKGTQRRRITFSPAKSKVEKND